MNIPDYSSLEYQRFSLTTGKNEKLRVPYSSGLNWGQRPGREPNQAYISVPVYIQKSNFLPLPGVEFSILTDDGELWTCARRQQNGKAIHTIHNNSIIGKYFRKRLNIENGELVTISHLLEYGRTSIELYKQSKRQFILDFKPNK